MIDRVFSRVFSGKISKNIFSAPIFVFVVSRKRNSLKIKRIRNGRLEKEKGFLSYIFQRYLEDGGSKVTASDTQFHVVSQAGFEAFAENVGSI